MAGPIGSGKTTYAKRLAAEKNAAFLSIDEQLKHLGHPIRNTADYEEHYFGMRDVIAKLSLEILSRGVSVVLDFGGTAGHWNWLKSLADEANADVEIYNLIVPLEVRRERVKARNSEPDAIFRFSAEEFDSMPTESTTPKEQPGLKVIEVRDQAERPLKP